MHLYFVGLDVHKQVIAYCVKTASGEIVMEGKIPATRAALDAWVKTLPGPWAGGWKRHCSAIGFIITLIRTPQRCRWDMLQP
jgi:hypothetical protein